MNCVSACLEGNRWVAKQHFFGDTSFFFLSVLAQPRCISKNALFYQKNDAFRQQIQSPNMNLITPDECSLCLTNLNA